MVRSILEDVVKGIEKKIEIAKEELEKLDSTNDKNLSFELLCPEEHSERSCDERDGNGKQRDRLEDEEDGEEYGLGSGHKEQEDRDPRKKMVARRRLLEKNIKNKNRPRFPPCGNPILL